MGWVGGDGEEQGKEDGMREGSKKRYGRFELHVQRQTQPTYTYQIQRANANDLTIAKNQVYF